MRTVQGTLKLLKTRPEPLKNYVLQRNENDIKKSEKLR